VQLEHLYTRVFTLAASKHCDACCHALVHTARTLVHAHMSTCFKHCDACRHTVTHTWCYTLLTCSFTLYTSTLLRRYLLYGTVLYSANLHKHYCVYNVLLLYLLYDMVLHSANLHKHHCVYNVLLLYNTRLTAGSGRRKQITCQCGALQH
jgi:hypothetical protein